MPTPGMLSGTDLPASAYLVFVGRELAQAHRPAGVQAVRADPDLGSEPELVAVREARGGVHEHARGVDRTQEALRRLVVAGDDGLGEAGPVTRDEAERRIERGDHAYAEDQIEVFRVPVRLGGGDDVRHQRPRARAPTDLAAL